eukprot:7049151-Pyramimonas_sp.AAC.1
MKWRYCRRDRASRGSEYGLTGSSRPCALHNPPGKGAPAGRPGRKRAEPWRRRPARRRGAAGRLLVKGDATDHLQK